MKDVPNTEYITINKDGVFVGGKPAIKYRGVEIYDIDYVKEKFACMQDQNPEIEEFHIGAFIYYGRHGRPEDSYWNVDSQNANVWCRVKLKNSSAVTWIFCDRVNDVARCALECMFYYVGSHIYARYGMSSDWFRLQVLKYARIDKQNTKLEKLEKVDFRSAVFGSKQNALTNALKDTDLSQFVGKPVQLNGYKIIVEKIAETKQIKR